MLRALLLGLRVVFHTLRYFVPCVLAARADRSGRRAHAVIRAWAQALLRAEGVTVRVEGAPQLSDAPAVYAANHASAADIPIVFGALPFDFRIIYKRSLSFVPLVGWGLVAAGHVAIDRSNPFRARRSLERAAERIRRGQSVLVFPEGTRSPDGCVRHFKRGSFVLAMQAGVPVVPVSLVGVKRLAPRGLASLRAGEVTLKIHPPVPTAGRRVEDAAALAEEVRAIVARDVSLEDR